jgi:hypothetical protein
VGAELHVSRRACDPIRLGGQARLGWSGQAHASADQWISVCAPLPETTFEFGNELQWDVRPTLLAPIWLRPGLNRSETFRVHWQPVHFDMRKFSDAPITDPNEAPKAEATIFEIHSAMTWLWSSGGPLSMVSSADAMMLTYRRFHSTEWGERRDYTVAGAGGGGVFNDNGALVRVNLLDIENLEVGHDVYLDTHLGFSGGGAGPFVDQYRRDVDLTRPSLALGAEWAAPHARAHVRATSDLTLVPDGFITYDHKLSSGLGLDVGNTTVWAEAVGGLSEAHVPMMPVRRAVVGGGSISFVRALSPHVQASAQVELARGFYGVDEAMQDFTPRWALRTFAGVQAVVGR